MEPPKMNTRKGILITFVVALCIYNIVSGFDALSFVEIVSFNQSDARANATTLNSYTRTTTPPTSPATTDSPMREQEKKYCRVAITNSYPAHYETLESIAAFLPLEYLKDPISNPDLCPTIIFDYHIWAVEQRYKSWVTYFQQSVKGKTYDNSNNTQYRIVGNLTLHTAKADDGVIQVNNDYDAVLEASCYCCCPGAYHNHPKWMKEDDRRSCIFHGSCTHMADNPRSVWISPHHKNHYLPLALPVVEGYDDSMGSRKKDGTPPTLCVVGSTDRRNWDLLRRYMDSLPSLQEIKSRFRIQIFGLGSFPQQMIPYREIVRLDSPVGFREFHERVAKTCDAVMTLLTKDSNADYFHTPKSMLKLTGALPIVLAYGFPVVIHEELYEVYKGHFPTDLLYATHSDDPHTFVTAMNDFLSRLDGGAKGNNSAVLRMPPALADKVNGAILESPGEPFSSIQDMLQRYREYEQGQESQSSQGTCQVGFRNPQMALCYYLSPELNFGDALGPAVVERLISEAASRQNPRHPCKPSYASVNIHGQAKLLAPNGKPYQCMYALGSVFHFVRPRDHIWGIGINPTHQHAVAQNLEFYSVRGQLTHNKLLSLQTRGVSRSLPQGDPGFLIPFLYPQYYDARKERREKNDSPIQFCFVPHAHDSSRATLDLGAMSNLKIMSVHQEWRAVVGRMANECDYVSSSSLHGVVVADALGIPSMWFQWEDSRTSQTEGSFKYLDYFSTVDRKQDAPVKDTAQITNASSYLPPMTIDMQWQMVQNTMMSFPFHLFQMVVGSDHLR